MGQEMHVPLLLVAALTAGPVIGAAWISLHRRKRQLTEALGQALTDPLTGVANRRRLEADIAASARDLRRRVAVLMVDIDHFKGVNDRHGHPAGDLVLREVGAALDAILRGDDVVYRYGGEEFCVLLPSASLPEAEVVAERVRTVIGRVEAPDGGHLSASVGVADGLAATIRSTIERADRALYAAKGAGRNRIQTDSEPFV